MTQTNLSIEQKQTHGHREQSGGCQGGGDWGRGGMGGLGVSRCKLLYREWINNKVLLSGTETYIQCPGISHNGKEYFKKNVYICITESLCCTAVLNITL